MFFKYLWRELGKRRRQTAVVASGLALASGLVVVVNATSAGVQRAQGSVLESLYGIGTDISVSKTGAEGQPGTQRFNIGSGAGKTADGSRTFSRSRLRTSPVQGTLTGDELATVANTSGVAASTGTLKLESVTFNGELPDFVINQQGGQMGPGQQPQVRPTAAPTGGSDGKGGSAFDITTFSVEGVDPAVSDLGPLSAVTYTSGRALTPADAGAYVAVVDADYATTNEVSVDGTLTIAGKTFTVVGIAKSTSATGSSASNVYIPVDVAQTLSGNSGAVTNVYVKVANAKAVDTVATVLRGALSGATVNSSSELASSVTGTLTSAGNMINSLGKGLSYIVLAAAFLIGGLLTASGVGRRTREFGTLKAVGWRSRRIVGQVMGESLVTGLIGGAAGVGVGAAGVWAVNRFAPALSANLAPSTGGRAGFGPGMGGGMGPGQMRDTAQSTVSMAIDARMSPTIMLLALGLAALGGILAGMFGGWRASRLSPAESLRSVA